jgi:aryl-alcohol dehydrogenase-like predicted oxidoreductase
MGSVIFGATDNFQLQNILKGLDVVLSEELMSDINKLYKKFPITF